MRRHPGVSLRKIFTMVDWKDCKKEGKTFGWQKTARKLRREFVSSKKRSVRKEENKKFRKEREGRKSVKELRERDRRNRKKFHINLLCDRADDVYDGRLPIHVRCLLDEFANIGQIPKFEKLIATIRSREISASIILQSKSQLKAIYKDNADTIEGNCDTTLFLGGKEKTTLKEMAEILGKETIDLYNTSDTRGSQRSYGLNYQKTGKELMSQDEIAVMDGGKCIMQLRGVRPFFSDKFDICKHKNYKYLSDYDKKNRFDIEKYLSTNLVMKPDEEVEVYRM